MNKILALIALSLFAPAVQSSDFLDKVRVGNLMVSNHWSPESKHTNEDHSDSLYICYSEFCGGSYEHSFNDTAHLAFYDYEVYAADWVEIRLPIGVVEGYQGYSTVDKYIPFVALTAYFPGIKTKEFDFGVRVWQIGKEVTAVGFEAGFE